MNFLVTGGAGFVGYHVCERLLRDGQAVWAFDDLNNFYNPKIKAANIRDLGSLAKPFAFVHGDLTDRAGLDQLLSSVKFDQIIHLAARAGVRPSLLEPALYQRVNVEGTVNLLEAARLNGVKKATIAIFPPSRPMPPASSPAKRSATCTITFTGWTSRCSASSQFMVRGSGPTSPFTNSHGSSPPGNRFQSSATDRLPAITPM